MFYVDTNILVSALTPETARREARQWLLAHQMTSFVSDWVIAEFSRSLSVKSRYSDFSEADRFRARVGLKRYLEASLAVLPVGRDDFRVAADFCEDPELGLRAGDALHLAIASAHGLTMITRDHGMARAARQLGLPATLMQEIS